ncbi:hypothetical protein I2I05_12725 [Hymenobacter sp. BT683]|uniref:Uncharacterized protein n=1 Tax=Hymenobacter jeongseonensis TaxID=2791027 RepID=A0ABS0IIT7_9BACT|nr:hypothetical protein [Hymenobacter jeongseonensis]MBF9238261.1 hypothetical protein [Hymenobacter jeongseonensis]
MKKATAVLRHYSEPDATMRQSMRTMHEQFTAHQATFQAFNPEFDAAFGPDWLAAIDLADTTPDHTVRVGELMEDTAEVQTVMAQAQSALQSLFYFVGRAFPKNAGRLATYGRTTYEAARDNHDKMRTLLQTAFTSATRDHTELAAKGYGAAQLAALGTLVTQLADTNTTQEVKKGTNTEEHEHYLTVQNLAYGFGQEASGAAKVLFADDKATRDLFRLSGRAASGRETHELTAAPNGVAAVAFTTPLVATTRLHLRLAVPKAGQSATVGRVLAAGDAPTLTVTLSDEISEMDVLADLLGAPGQVLIVQSGGNYPVRVELEVLG